ncbi:ATP-binding protein [Cysteiniphilum sp. JM-1]|uniref:ATP-binding protein n=1 Tax=Cysteiniphilum sp. JM-1 TaxID=2610891 RepID=UPI0021E2A344|nr:ATP-binding protein [Cysteiniphilum sp. JM-1]
MHIHKVKISNFKGYFDQQFEFSIPNGRKGSGLNILVGENNTGKSTIFEAISFVRNGVSDISQIVNKNANSSAQVDLTFTGDIKQILESFAQEKKIDTLGKLIYDQNGVGFFQISRNTDEEKKIKVWNESDQSFANPSGIDAVIKGIFELNFVWADTNPNDQAKFGASTVCGKLLKGISTALHDQSEYKAFKESFHKIFNNEDSLLQKQLNIIEEKVQGIFHEQFGDASISFKFNELDSDSFFKNVTIQVDDGISTTLSEKGSGMQRAVF